VCACVRLLVRARMKGQKKSQNESV
jgi:hypothetical protein